MSKVPVLFLMFNRKEVALRAFESIRSYRPERLYIAADGPRADRAGEAEKCAGVRDAVMAMVDWGCEVETIFRDTNWGCAKSNYDSISRFFEKEEYGIIIEDDVIVSRDFYKACEELLPRYAGAAGISEISAFNPVASGRKPNKFVLSNDLCCCGWASWRRAWKMMDMDMKAWPAFPKAKLIKAFGLFKGLMMNHYWNWGYRHRDSWQSWASRWCFCQLAGESHTLVPDVNLALNIGMEIEGAHFRSGMLNPYKGLGMGSLSFPLEVEPMLEKAQNRRERRFFRHVRWVGILNKFR